MGGGAKRREHGPKRGGVATGMERAGQVHGGVSEVSTSPQCHWKSVVSLHHSSYA